MSVNEKKIVIVAALEREVAPLVKVWRRTSITAQSGTVKVFENEDAIVVCGGMGSMRGRIATEAAYQHVKGDVGLCISAGFAGALHPSLTVGDIVQPREVISEADGQRISTASGKSLLVSAGAVAGKSVKRRFAQMYGTEAVAVDMEAYSVGDVASIYKIPFIAVKAISDELDFAMPPLGRFVTDNGQFGTAGFAAYAAVRPWIWPTVIQLGKNAAIAAEKLAAALRTVVESYRAEQDLYNAKYTVNPGTK
jgi:purine-nucleoside phosphorylase